MISSTFPLRLPLVEYCCGVCTLKKPVGSSTWCITTTTCTGGCQCGDYTLACEFPEEMTGINPGPSDQFITVLCTPCAEQYGSYDACGALCAGECLVEVVEIFPGVCTGCVHDRTCAWGGTAEPGPGELCDCKFDCAGVNCEIVGITFITACEQKFPPTPVCPECP